MLGGIPRLASLVGAVMVSALRRLGMVASDGGVETIFKVASAAVMPFWLLMILAPRWKVTHRVMKSFWPVLVLAALYAVLVIPRLPAVFPVVLRPDLPAVQALLGSVDGATIGWVHYLAFDLFVGRWAYLDSRNRGVNPWLMAPVLFLTLMLGPVGFLAYFGVRMTRRPAAGA